jgi:cellulose synthase (UDP-forming)
MMIKVGVIEQRAFLNVLQRIEQHAKTGLLTFIHNEQEAELYFQQGQLTSISLKNGPALGERLVQAGIISQDALQEALLTLLATNSQALATNLHGDVLMAQTLLKLGKLHREQLNAWVRQEAVEILQDLLTWSESDVSFTEGVATPPDRLPLNYYITSLLSSLSDEKSTSHPSLGISRSMRSKESASHIPVPVPLFKSVQTSSQDTPDPRISAYEKSTSHLSLGISRSVRSKESASHLPAPVPLFKSVQTSSQDTPDPRISAYPLPGLVKTSTPHIMKITLPTRVSPTDEEKTSVKKPTTASMKAPKRDPHLEMLNTISISAIKAITQPKRMKNLKIRITGVFFIIASLVYTPWMLRAMNTQVLWFALPFIFATTYITLFLYLTIYNNWNRSVPQLFKLPDGVEPMVAILIPTYGEPMEMVQKTIESVLQQNWPQDAMLIIIGDDSHNPKMQYMVEGLQKQYALAHIIYHLPPPKNSPERIGRAKDGNLNSMLKLVSQQYPEIGYIETRDADDLVGNPNFLRYTIGHLVSNPKAAYVQTIKEAIVSPGDPFGNMQPVFYRGLLLSKHATNSVFPCGSGLVWSKRPLEKIGGFPTWNLVEDLYSGYVAMQHGFKGSYLPIVGAIGQVAPEDIPNFYKQLGTWALDTMRMFLWKNPWLVKGLTFQQRMHFTEMGLWYLSSFVQLIFFLTPPICLFTGMYPLRPNDFVIFLIILFAYTFLIDILLFFVGHNVTFKENWRAKQLFAGMMFVYMKAAVLAIIYGPHKKPVYKVTRKVQIVGLYFREVFFQIMLFLFLFSSIIYTIVIHKANLLAIDLGSVAWIIFYMVILSGIISKSWYGLNLTQLTRKEKSKSHH